MQCQKLKTYMETGRVIFLSVKSIRPNPAQPRRIFSQDALSELADSIRQHGVLQPLSVRRIQGGYELIAGERRLRAAQLAGLGEVPCLVMQMDDKESGLAAMIENLQRQDLDFVEEAQGIAALMRTQNLSQEQAARLLGKSQSAVANKLRLLRHGETVLSALREAGLYGAPRPGAAEAARRGREAGSHCHHSTPGALCSRHGKICSQSSLSAAPSRPRKTDISSFLNTLTDSLAKIQRSGVKAISERRETDVQIVLTITIPKG